MICRNVSETISLGKHDDHIHQQTVNPHLPMLLAVTSETRSLIALLSLFNLILLGILIEGLIKGRFLGKAIAIRKDNPFFYYFTATLLAYVIVRICMFLKDLIQ